MVSFPPDIMRPFGKSLVGGRYVIALINAEPWEIIEQSYLRGFSGRSFHRRTVASLEADKTKFGCGKTTPRTYDFLVCGKRPLNQVLTSSSCCSREAESL